MGDILCCILIGKRYVLYVVIIFINIKFFFILKVKKGNSYVEKMSEFDRLRVGN